MKQLNIYSELVDLYNKDKYHIEFLDKLGDILKPELMSLYLDALNLSFKAPFSDEMNDSYQITIELLNKSMGFKYRPNGDIYYKEETE